MPQAKFTEIKNRAGEVLFSYEGQYAPCEMTDADLTGAVFDDQTLEGADFSMLRLPHASFKGAQCYWAHFFQTNLEHANFEWADLRGADLKQACLRNANLQRANLGTDNLGGATDLEQADVCGADLRYANLKGAKLAGAIYDRETKFPTGFKPSSEMVFDKTKR